LALASAGSRSAARIAMMAMTTNNSIKVNPFCRAVWFLRVSNISRVILTIACFMFQLSETRRRRP
jgi:hypothetical protein